MIYVDTDVLLDVALRRVPFWIDAASLLNRIAKGEIKAGTTPLVIANCLYIIQRLEDKSSAEAFTESSLLLLEEIPLTFNHQKQALVSSFKDKEDGFNYFAAIDFGCQAIITRNKSDFQPGKIPIFTAGEYLEKFPKS
jgi:predicted nucleic acid-binding protein